MATPHHGEGRTVAERREAILASRDYGTLLAQLAQAIEAVLGVTVSGGSLLLRHAVSPNLRICVRRRGNLQFHEPPMQSHPCIEEHALSLGDVSIVLGRVGEYYRRQGVEAPELTPMGLLMMPFREESGVSAAGVFELGGPLAITNVATLDSDLTELRTAVEAALPACRELETLRTAKDNMQEIFEAATLLEGSEDPRVVARSAAEVFCERLGFDRAIIALFQPATSELVGIASHNCGDAHTALRISVLSSTSILSSAFREGGVRWLPEVTQGLAGAESVFPSRGHHGVCLPLLVNGRAIGVLYGDHTEDRVQVAPTRLVNLQLFANSVASRLEAASLMAQLARLAELDGLTGLANRRAFDQTLRKEIGRCQRTGGAMALLMIDIDRFKELNDTLGHLAGDEVLIETAQLLQRCVRDTDFVARFGGDEFVVLMPGTDGSSAETVLERIRTASRDLSNRLHRGRWNFSLSLGLRSAIGDDAERLLENADKALYEHKEAQVRDSLLNVLTNATEDALLQWDHYLGKLLRVLLEKDPDWLLRARSMSQRAEATARRLALPEDRVQAVKLAALLLDVGMISIPGIILQRSGPLTPHERRAVQSHPKIGDELLREVGYLGDICEIVRHHHERFDGNTEGDDRGYPGERAGTDIPVGARILRVVESYESMTRARPWREALSIRNVRAHLELESRAIYDPAVVEAFFAAMNDSAPDLRAATEQAIAHE